MKKVFSLLLAITMLCSFLPIMASAADVNYDFSLATTVVGARGSTNYLEKYGVVGLVIKATGAKFTSGSIGFTYDNSKVKPAVLYEGEYFEYDSSIGDTPASLITTTAFDGATNFATVTQGAVFVDDTNGKIVVNLQTDPSKKDSLTGVSDTLLSILFKPVTAGATVESVSDAFGVIASDDQYLVDCSVKVNGGAGVFFDSLNITYKTDEGTLGMTGIVAADEPDPVVTESCVVAGGVATVTAVYTEEVTGTPIIAVYDADGRMLTYKEGTAVAAQTSFTVATDAFEGTAATVKVFVWENVGNKNTAKVAAKVFDDEIVFN